MTKTHHIAMSAEQSAVRPNPMIIAFFAPIVSMIFALVTLAIVNLVFNPTFWVTPDTEPVTPTPIVISILNQILLSIGVIGLVCLIPGIIAGTVLLARRKRASAANSISS